MPRIAAARNRWLPPLLVLLLVFAALYLAGDGWGGLYQYHRNHDWNTAKNMALAENLSPAHNFLMFFRQYPGPDGAPVYEPYNRFPVGGFALIKLAILPFGDDLSARLYAARMLMLLMFAAAAMLAYASLRRITASHCVALAATLLAFSSYYLLYYSDMVSNEVTMDLFAVLLVFHGITVYAQEKRFGQLLLKTGLALLIGWHVYALLLPFIAIGLSGEIIRAARGNAFPDSSARLRNIAAALRRSRYLRLGMAAFLFGAALLSFNLANEYAALDGETPLMELPSIQSAIKRIGQNAEYNESRAEYLNWDQFLPDQFRRLGRMSLPFALTVYLNGTGGLRPQHPAAPIRLPYGAIGMAVTSACLLGLLFLRRHRLPLAALALSGLVWGLGMRSNTGLHLFESVFYIGLTLSLFTLILLWIKQWRGGRLPAIIVAAALAIFLLSAWQHGRTEAADAMHPVFETGVTPPSPETRDAAMSDFHEIRRMTRGQRIYLNIHEVGPFVSPHFPRTAPILDYFLTGSVIQYSQKSIPGCGPECAQHYDFVISSDRNLLPNPLTPANRLVFLFDADGGGRVTAEYRSTLKTAISGGYGEPFARSEFDVYTDGGRLIYHKSQCQPEDAAARFSLHVTPANAADLPPDRQEYGFNNLDFDFIWLGAFLDSDCLVIAKLPDYPIVRIRTGQSLQGGLPIWQVATNPAAQAQMRAIETRLENSTPAARGFFDVHLDGDNVVYRREPCVPADAEARFFLHAVPASGGDLPEDRRQSGFINLDFDFDRQGAIFANKCLAAVPLPDYLVKSISTGQHLQGGQIWQSEITLTPEMQMRRIESSLENPAPAASGFFDLYLDGNELIYRRAPCAPADAAARFFLHLIPVDGNDLPESRQQSGFDNLDFDFAGRGAISAGKCLASAPLPDYPIARIRTGQHIAGQGQLWQADFHPAQ